MGRQKLSVLDLPAWNDAFGPGKEAPPGASPSFMEAVVPRLEGATGGAVLIESDGGRAGLPFIEQGGAALAGPFGLPAGPVPLEGEPPALDPKALRKAIGADKLNVYVHHSAAGAEVSGVEQTFSTHVVPLDRGDPREGFRKRAKQNMKAAEKAGIETRVGTADDADLIVDILTEATAEAGRAMFPDKEIVRAIAAGPDADLVFALHDGKEVSAGLFISSQLEMLYWMSGSLIKSSKFSPSYPVLDKAIALGAGRGSRFLNFGASEGLPSVSHFKEGFGAEEVSYPALESSSRRARR